MKIDMNDVFIGTINKCTFHSVYNIFSSETYIGNDLIGTDSFGFREFKGEPYKRTVLLRVNRIGYVDLGNLNNILDELKLKSQITKTGVIPGDLIITEYANKVGDLYVDIDSLTPYTLLEEEKNMTVKKLKKKLELDPRIPGGFEG